MNCEYETATGICQNDDSNPHQYSINSQNFHNTSSTPPPLSLITAQNLDSSTPMIEKSPISRCRKFPSTIEDLVHSINNDLNGVNEGYNDFLDSSLEQSSQEKTGNGNSLMDNVVKLMENVKPGGKHDLSLSNQMLQITCESENNLLKRKITSKDNTNSVGISMNDSKESSGFEEEFSGYISKKHRQLKNKIKISSNNIQEMLDCQSSCQETASAVNQTSDLQENGLNSLIFFVSMRFLLLFKLAKTKF